MSKTVILTLDGIETITKTAELVVQVPDSITSQEIEELVLGLDLANHPGLDWGIDYQDFEVHAAKVTERIEECGKPDVVIKRVGEEFVAGVNQ
jgi:hypothetical protein